jgi:hypothetical protein
LTAEQKRRKLENMKSVKLSFDFSDRPQLAEMLRVQAARQGTTQKAIVIDALEAYFAHKLESAFLLKAAEDVFREWDNEDDQVYDSL